MKFFQNLLFCSNLNIYKASSVRLFFQEPKRGQAIWKVKWPDVITKFNKIKNNIFGK